ncbi:endosome-associated-trafficking regulator 1-like [Physella acuta]|uniref:endosome-associated-trafficking regulator 1-like n=1 Tax=Physella acuta TaxID=109671 RepID=UPI0027DC66DA|nr:endosome-associated-trafficking regulator 1-like [Physella acuta]
MAERGVNDVNPFSFKTFVGKDKKVSTQRNVKKSEIDTDDIFGVDKASDVLQIKENVNLEKSSFSLVVEVDEGGGGSSKKEKQKDNPFSFKKFLSSTSSQSKGGADSLFPLVPDSVSDLPLAGTDIPPSSIIPTAQLLEPKLNTSLPTVDCDLIADSFLQLPNHSTSSSHELVLKQSSFNDIEYEDEIDNSILTDNGRKKLALPDFLSDGAALSGHKSSSNTIEKNLLCGHEDLLEEIRILKEENIKLQGELMIERQSSSEKNQKLLQLKIDLERQKKKELEETAVLERAVQQVEENLVTTTNCAVQAESTVAMLKKEIKVLNSQIKSLLLENEAYKSGDGGLSDIRERTKYTADQLHTAAAGAEKNIKELLTGVDKLRLLSQVLASLEKVSEVKPDSPEHDTKPS